MNAREFAAMLDGRQYLNEITDMENELARENGLVVMFGYSDDNVELRGSIDDELPVSESMEIKFFFNHGAYLLEGPFCGRCSVVMMMKDHVKRVNVIYEQGTWRFETNIPHETFRIMEDGELFCTGIVFSVRDK